MNANDTLPPVNTELVKFEGESEDQFFGHQLIETDWNTVLQNPASIRLADEIDAIKHHEPITPGHPFEHQIWVHQQRLRIGLRHNAGLPLLGDTCESCGTNRADPVLEECLVCAELNRQVDYRGSRGSCFFIKPCWDIKSKSWGILYYWSHYDDTFIFFLATGYKGWLAACKALMPITKYERWLDRKYMGIGNFWRVSDELLPLEQLMEKKKDMPWTPETFEAHLKWAIRNHMHQDHDVLNYAISRALDDYKRGQQE